MKIIILFAALILSFSGFSQQGQPTTEYFAVFIVDSVPSIQDYRDIDYQMRLVEGVLISRMDIPTGRYYVRFNSDVMFDEMWFRNKFLALGDYSIHCIQLGEKDVDQFIPITKSTCPELNKTM